MSLADIHPAPGLLDAAARIVPALPMPSSTRRLRLAAPDATFDRDVQVALDRRARQRGSDADEVLSGHDGPITAGD